MHLLSLLTDSAGVIDSLLAHQSGNELIQFMLKYLTCCRSPCKMLVTRGLTQLCLRVRTTMPGGSFEMLLRVMEQLYESNSASGWGSSPFLMALMDVIRCRPTFKLSDSEAWNVESIDNRHSSWFFLNVLRTESLSRAIYNSQRLPSRRPVDKAFHELSDIEILRWNLKQPELCLKLQKQRRGWNNSRRDWMNSINTFESYSQCGELLIQLKDSLLPECYRSLNWTVGSAGAEWEARCKSARTCSDIANAFIELEGALKWGDVYSEPDRAFADTWASRRGDWMLAMKGLASGTVVRVASPQEALDYKWNRTMDEALVAYIDHVASVTSRRLMSMTFRDIEPLQLDDSNIHLYAPIKHVPIEHIRARFAILKMLSNDYLRVIPLVDLSFTQPWSISPLMKATSKTLIFHQSKIYLWRSILTRIYSDEKPQFVILNRHEAAKTRSNDISRLQHSLFYQLYQHVGILCDPASLRRRGQAWMVKFVGEGGHDVGGLYNESLVDLCNELQADQPHNYQQNNNDAPTGAETGANASHNTLQPLLPFFRLCPNGQHGVGENRGKYIPYSKATRPLHLSMFEFVGRLLGTCCLDNNRALPVDFPSLIWKCLVGEPIKLADLKAIDHHTWYIIDSIRNPHQNQVTAETFEFLFPELYFVVESTSGQEIELIPNGKNILVTYENSQLYANLLEKFRCTEFNKHITSICRGVASIVPLEFLSIFTWNQLEVMIAGNPEIDISLLREKTEYRGQIAATDKHIEMFWEVLESFSQEDRQNFLQFVWGRNRLPANALGFGRDLFKLSDHAQAIQTNKHDLYLPVAHTCFFALELPRYSSKEIIRDRLLYAIRNCSSIDGDHTHEGRANMMMSWEDSDSD